MTQVALCFTVCTVCPFTTYSHTSCTGHAVLLNCCQYRSVCVDCTQSLLLCVPYTMKWTELLPIKSVSTTTHGECNHIPSVESVWWCDEVYGKVVQLMCGNPTLSHTPQVTVTLSFVHLTRYSPPLQSHIVSGALLWNQLINMNTQRRWSPNTVVV